jgi:5-methylcytosine-specific restriction endonuclease McrA
MKNVRPPSTLTASVLVLNRFYLAVHVVAVRRALVLLYRELAEVIHVEDGQYLNYDFEAWREVSEYRAAQYFSSEGPLRYMLGDRSLNDGAHGDLLRVEEPHVDWIQAVNFRLQAPRVIRLLEFDRSPRQTLRFNRRNLFARDGHNCQYCGKNFPTQQLSLDHVVPRSRGGKTTWENVVSACVDCNTRKGSRTPTEARMKLIRRPVKPKYSPILAMKLGNPEYASWRPFLAGGEAVLEAW